VIASLAAIVKRDLLLAVRAGAGVGLMFFLAVVIVVPFAIGPDIPLIARVGPAVLWLGAFLASLLGFDGLFSADQEDGSLDLLFLAPVPLELVAAAKGLAHWLATGLPLVILAPLLGLLLGVEPRALGAVTLSLLVGTPALTFLGLVGAAIAAALPRSGLFVAVLTLPLAIPVLIFGVGATGAAIAGEAVAAPFKFALALTLFFLVLGPLAAAAALRHARD
jgi:heme exporter protein B